MDNIVSGATGAVHLAFAIIALITGLYILVTTKGTRLHKRVGYLYAFSMIVLNVTAFMIYKLYGKFGIFHWFAVVSLLTLFGGLYPILTRKIKNYILIHFSFMYWSVIGLYCAFMAEVFSRLPKYVLTETGEPMTIFYKLVGFATALVMVVGILFYIKYRPKWAKEYNLG